MTLVAFSHTARLGHPPLFAQSDLIATMARTPGASMNYHLLASLMSVQPDFAIFKRFLASNARDLLRLQGEIVHLESNLEAIIANDRASGDPERAEFEFCIAALKGPPHPSREKGLQWEVQLELSHKLSAYSKLLSYRPRHPGWRDIRADLSSPIIRNGSPSI